MAILKQIKGSLARNLLPRRAYNSHKGQNGRVLIVGGSLEYYGAPLLAGLGALYSGADLVYLYVPECNFEVSRSLYPDFIVRSYTGDFLTERSADAIVKFGKKCDSILMGPGLGEREQTVDAVLSILNELHIPTVLDAEAMMALKKIDKFPLSQSLVITPHMNEFRNLVDRDVEVKESDSKSIVLLRSIAMDLHLTVLLKGATDYVSSHEGLVEVNKTGNAGMTVGGSGDVLAGLLASLMAQGLEAFDAARCAAFYSGHAGDLLRKQKGFAFSASDIAMTLPYAIDKV
ncbi:NAD(P)H-hydrate dehydratase [Candidatus Peregrinibacteria bacterium]|nr:NAD(P)H-hydrate dehydratase [Candidatus Peregrinibacteria bacterium]